MPQEESLFQAETALLPLGKSREDFFQSPTTPNRAWRKILASLSLLIAIIVLAPEQPLIADWSRRWRWQNRPPRNYLLSAPPGRYPESSYITGRTTGAYRAF